MRIRATLVAILIFGLVLANTVWWSRGIPFGKAPDEPDHYAVVKFAADHGRLPHYGDPGFTVSLMNGAHRHVANPTSARSIMGLVLRPQAVELRQTYLFVPQLPYALNALFCRALGGAKAENARLFSGACVAGVALFAFLAGLSLWPGRLLPAAVAGTCIGLWPQLTFLGAYVNDDAFAMLSASTLLAACAWCQGGRLDRRRALALGTSVGLVGASKPTVLILLPLAAIWFFRWSRTTIGDVAPARAPAFRRHLALGLAVAAILVCPWLVRNTILYEGDPTGHRFAQKQLRAFVTMLPDGVLPAGKQLSIKPASARPNVRQAGESWLRITFASLWGRFGWMNVLPPTWLILSAYGVLAIGLLWSLRPRGRASAARPPTAARAWWGVPRWFGLPALVLLVAISIANSYVVDFQPQGRYLLPCAPAIVLQVAGGLGGEDEGLLSRAFLVLFLLFFVFQNLFCRLSVLP